MERLQLNYKEKNLESKRQYGFRKKKSIEDAFLYLRSEIEARKKYAVILFIDVEGAFNNLW